MVNRRSAKCPTPLREDHGIFKTGVVDVRLALTPMSRISSRGDLVIVGYIDGEEIEVVIPGRRIAASGSLKAELSRQSIKNGRLPLRAKGIWRTRLMSLDEVETKRVYQFLMSEWTLRGDQGEDITFGEPPRKK